MMIKTRWKRINRDLHRDIGYFCTSLIIAYSISGLAFNHINDWNVDFILYKDTIQTIPIESGHKIKDDWILKNSKLVKETKFKLYDFPTSDQVKIYFDQSSLHIYLTENKGIYESIKRRPLLYEMNALHRNSIQYWKWASDVFAILLIAINITGLLILKGKYGLSGRGKWLLLLGAVPPLVMVLFFII